MTQIWTMAQALDFSEDGKLTLFDPDLLRVRLLRIQNASQSSFTNDASSPQAE
jgi:hypothetical protein